MAIGRLWAVCFGSLAPRGVFCPVLAPLLGRGAPALTGQVPTAGEVRGADRQPDFHRQEPWASSPPAWRARRKSSACNARRSPQCSRSGGHTHVSGTRQRDQASVGSKKIGGGDACRAVLGLSAIYIQERTVDAVFCSRDPPGVGRERSHGSIRGRSPGGGRCADSSAGHRRDGSNAKGTACSRGHGSGGWVGQTAEACPAERGSQWVSRFCVRAVGSGFVGCEPPAEREARPGQSAQRTGGAAPKKPCLSALGGAAWRVQTAAARHAGTLQRRQERATLAVVCGERSRRGCCAGAPRGKSHRRARLPAAVLVLGCWGVLACAVQPPTGQALARQRPVPAFQQNGAPSSKPVPSQPCSLFVARINASLARTHTHTHHALSAPRPP